MKNHTLGINNLHKSFTQAGQETPVLRGISITFTQGHCYAITGVSGSGKSTLLHLLAGLDLPNQGTIEYDERPLSLFSAQEKALFLAKHIGLVFQQPYLIRELTVLENVMVKGLLAKESKESVEKKARALLNQVGLGDKLHHFPGQLSGGQQQRVAIARALMNQPYFLLADEPSGSLDVATGKEIVELLLRLQKEWHMGLIMSSHEPYVYERMETILELKNGMLV